MVLPWLTKTKEQKQKYSPKFVLAKLNFSLCLPVWVPEQQLQQRQRHREGLTGPQARHRHRPGHCEATSGLQGRKKHAQPCQDRSEELQQLKVGYRLSTATIFGQVLDQLAVFCVRNL